MNNVDTVDGGAKRELITFLVAGQEFAVDVMSVREIRVWTPATPLAHAPAYVCGVINLRGAVLPILDFAVRMGLPPTTATTRHAILVVQAGDQVAGLLVEGVSEILTIMSNQIQATPDIASRATRDLVSGILAIDGRMISMVKLDTIAPPALEDVAA